MLWNKCKVQKMYTCSYELNNHKAKQSWVFGSRISFLKIRCSRVKKNQNQNYNFRVFFFLRAGSQKFLGHIRVGRKQKLGFHGFFFTEIWCWKRVGDGISVKGWIFFEYVGTGRSRRTHLWVHMVTISAIWPFSGTTIHLIEISLNEFHPNTTVFDLFGKFTKTYLCSPQSVT